MICNCNNLAVIGGRCYAVGVEAFACTAAVPGTDI